MVENSRVLSSSILLVLCALLPACASAPPVAVTPAELHQAIEAKEYDRVAAILAAQPELANTKNKSGDPVTIQAAFDGDARMVQIVLDAGADPNARDSEGTPAFEYSSYPEVMEVFLRHKISHEALDTSLFYCELWVPNSPASAADRARGIAMLRAAGAGDPRRPLALRWQPQKVTVAGQERFIIVDESHRVIMSSPILVYLLKPDLTLAAHGETGGSRMDDVCRVAEILPAGAKADDPANWHLALVENCDTTRTGAMPVPDLGENAWVRIIQWPDRRLPLLSEFSPGAKDTQDWRGIGGAWELKNATARLVDDEKAASRGP